MDSHGPLPVTSHHKDPNAEGKNGLSGFYERLKTGISNRKNDGNDKASWASKIFKSIRRQIPSPWWNNRSVVSSTADASTSTLDLDPAVTTVFVYVPSLSEALVDSLAGNGPVVVPSAPARFAPTGNARISTRADSDTAKTVEPIDSTDCPTPKVTAKKRHAPIHPCLFDTEAWSSFQADLPHANEQYISTHPLFNSTPLIGGPSTFGKLTIRQRPATASKHSLSFGHISQPTSSDQFERQVSPGPIDPPSSHPQVQRFQVRRRRSRIQRKSTGSSESPVQRATSISLQEAAEFVQRITQKKYFRRRGLPSEWIT